MNDDKPRINIIRNEWNHIQIRLNVNPKHKYGFDYRLLPDEELQLIMASLKSGYPDRKWKNLEITDMVLVDYPDDSPNGFDYRERYEMDKDREEKEKAFREQYPEEDDEEDADELDFPW